MLPPFLKRRAPISIPEGLERILRRFESRCALTPEGRDAVRKLPFVPRSIDTATYFVREGEPPTTCSILLSGFACRHKVTGDGERQILAVHLPGEFLDLQNSFLQVADHNVQALTRCTVGTVPVEVIRQLAEGHPTVGRAMWIDTLIDAAIFREWLLNVGRRPSTSRLAHFLCELALRLKAAGLSEDSRYELPMTQEQLADTTGLTPVHVNRVLKELKRLGLIGRDKRTVTILDWDGLRQVGDFSSRYLHLQDGTQAELESTS